MRYKLLERWILEQDVGAFFTPSTKQETANHKLLSNVSPALSLPNRQTSNGRNSNFYSTTLKILFHPFLFSSGFSRSITSSSPVCKSTSGFQTHLLCLNDTRCARHITTKIGIPTYAVKRLDADHLLGKTINPFSRHSNVNITKVM